MGNQKPRTQRIRRSARPESSPQYDRLIASAQVAQSEEDRLRILHEAEEILLDELPILPIYWYTRVYLKDPRVEGWNPKVLDAHPYKYVYFATN